MLQAALAALANVGVTPKAEVINHGWVQGTFARELINRRKIFPSMSSYLNDARFLRETADYKQVMLNQRKASQALRWARTMVEAIRKELETGKIGSRVIRICKEEISAHNFPWILGKTIWNGLY